ncbi:hypothetical protein ACFE04_015083 [Oxalis oulophora]
MLLVGNSLRRVIRQSINHVPQLSTFPIAINGRGKFTLADDLAAVLDESSIIDDEIPSKARTRQTLLAESLATVIEESSATDDKPAKSRMEQKRFLQLRIKKRVKEQYADGKFRNLVKEVIGFPETLKDAYDCIRLDSNVDITSDNGSVSFERLAEELSSGRFDVKANTFTVSTKGGLKEILVLPNLNLRIVQEAIKTALDVVYRPHFSKISHGCRSGRGQFTALRYIKREISNPDYWFTLHFSKKIDACILAKLVSIMEERIVDPDLYTLIQNMFDAEALNLEFGGFPKGHGLPQEGILSPVLINIYLDLFDREYHRLLMKYEVINPDSEICASDRPNSKLRSWIRRQLKEKDLNNIDSNNAGSRVYCCRFLDEIFFAFTGPEDVALGFKSEIVKYLQNVMHLEVDNQTDLVPCTGRQGVRFLGTLIKRIVKESPAVRSVHKLQEKVKLFAFQKQEAWDDGTVRIGKKWLGHGLKKVKESEIKHLADSKSTLAEISRFRKSGMETDHWYKYLLNVWMHDINAKLAESKDFILSKFVVEPALPQELRDSFYEFQKQADRYISSETANVLALIPISSNSNESLVTTEIIAPVDVIKKRLLRYGLTTSKGFARAAPLLVFQDNSLIIDWFSGIVRRWFIWYKECNNFTDIKFLITNQVRKSCIRTLAVKYRIHETAIEKKFDTELSRIPSTLEMEEDMEIEKPDSQNFDHDEALTYGIAYSGLCLLSLARMVSQSRPCNCFVIGCSAAAPSVYALHVMERQKFPGWKTGFSSCIHPSLNGRRIGLCMEHVKDLYLGKMSLQSIDFGAWK